MRPGRRPDGSAARRRLAPAARRARVPRRACAADTVHEAIPRPAELPCLIIKAPAPPAAPGCATGLANDDQERSGPEPNGLTELTLRGSSTVLPHHADRKGAARRSAMASSGQARPGHSRSPPTADNRNGARHACEGISPSSPGPHGTGQEGVAGEPQQLRGGHSVEAGAAPARPGELAGRQRGSGMILRPGRRGGRRATTGNTGSCLDGDRGPVQEEAAVATTRRAGRGRAREITVRPPGGPNRGWAR